MKTLRIATASLVALAALTSTLPAQAVQDGGSQPGIAQGHGRGDWTNDDNAHTQNIWCRVFHICND